MVDAAIVRTVRVGARPFMVLVDVPTRRVFVLAQTSPAIGGAATLTMSVLDATTGALLHRLSIGMAIYVGAATVDVQSGQLLLVTGSQVTDNSLIAGPGTVRVFDGWTGNPVRAYPAGVSPRAIAVDGARHRVFVLDAGALDSGGFPTGSATMRILNAVTGARLHAVPVGRQGLGGGYIALDTRLGRVFVTDTDGIQTLDEAAGATRAHTSLPTPPISLAVDERVGRVAVGLVDEQYRMEAVAILDARSGSVVRLVTGAGEAATIDSASGRLFVTNTLSGSSPSNVTVDTLDIRTGRTLASAPLTAGVGVTVVIAIDEPRRHAIVVSEAPTSGATRDLVSVLDAQSGRLKREHLLPDLGPPAVAVDRQTARVFVANAGDDTVSVLDATRL